MSLPSVMFASPPTRELDLTCLGNSLYDGLFPDEVLPMAQYPVLSPMSAHVMEILDAMKVPPPVVQTIARHVAPAATPSLFLMTVIQPAAPSPPPPPPVPVPREQKKPLVQTTLMLDNPPLKSDSAVAYQRTSTVNPYTRPPRVHREDRSYSGPTIEEVDDLDEADRAGLLRLAVEQNHLNKAIDYFYLMRPVPFLAGKRLFPFQEKVQNWMAYRETLPVIYGIQGYILNLEMGLGKTLITMSYILMRPRGEFPSLVVASLSVMGEWYKNAYKFFEKEYVEKHFLFLHPSKYKNIDSLRRVDLSDIYIVVTTYEMVTQSYKKLPAYIQDQHIIYKNPDKRTQITEIMSRTRSDANLPKLKGICLLHGTPWERRICDESQRLANPRSLLFRAIMGVNSRYAGHLTGTITRNYVTDLWSQLRALHYDGVTERKGWTIRSAPFVYEMHGLKNVIYRLTKEDAGIILPPCHVIRVPVTQTAKERQIYLLIHKKAADILQSVISKMASYASVLTMLLRLRQTAIAPWLINSRGAVDDMQAGATSQKLPPKKPKVGEKRKRKSKGKRGRAPKRRRLNTREMLGKGLLALSQKDIQNANQSNTQALAQRHKTGGTKLHDQVVEIFSSEEEEEEEASQPVVEIFSSDEESEEDLSMDIEKDSSLSGSQESGDSGDSDSEEEEDDDEEEEEGENNGKEDSMDMEPLEMLFESTEGITDYCRLEMGEGGFGATKIKAIFNTLRTFRREHPGEKLLGFSMFTSVLMLFSNTVKEAKRRSDASPQDQLEPWYEAPEKEWWYLTQEERRTMDILILEGSTPAVRRAQLLEEFARNECVALLLISGKAGGEGLDITSASGGLLFEPHYNYSTPEQEKARFHRIGQMRETYWYEFYTEDTIEQRVIEICEEKEKIARMFEAENPSKSAVAKGNDNNLLTIENIAKLLVMKKTETK